ncbi:MAG: hypothetical protein OXN21_00185 [Chloroflexota bacterium]|nr:hypothetical protein [Chloroflexota bacterium]
MTLPLNTAPGPSPDEESERHALISRDFLVKAREELDKGDLLQASEKAWGAAAHAIKAVAEKRRWFSEADWKLRQAALIVEDELDDRFIMGSYSVAREARYNFYLHHYTIREVERAIEAAEDLIARLTPTLASDYVPPHVNESVESRIRSLEQPTSDPDRGRLSNGRPPMDYRPPAVPAQE